MDRNLRDTSESLGSAPDPGPLLDLACQAISLLTEGLSLPIPEQIRRWQDHYGSVAPDLPPILYADYVGVEGGWRRIAEERIFPALSELLPRMQMALANLREICQPLCTRALATLEFRQQPVVVPYVGLGNGAGWATIWRAKPTVLIGLENVAELGWQDPDTLEGLLAHEMGHLFMMEVRGDIGPLLQEPFLALYEEGFAQHSEHMLLGRETWHCASQAGWVEWCTAHQRELAGLYLEAKGDRESWRRFFGSWFEIKGRRQTGYYLGCRFVRQQHQRCTLTELACWPENKIREAVAEFLRELAQSQQ